MICLSNVAVLNVYAVLLWLSKSFECKRLIYRHVVLHGFTSMKNTVQVAVSCSQVSSSNILPERIACNSLTYVQKTEKAYGKLEGINVTHFNILIVSMSFASTKNLS